MTLNISPNDTLKQVSDKFQSLFPNLKLEFADKAHGESEGSAKKALLPKDTSWSTVSKHAEPVVIGLSDQLKVKDVETLFEESFGVHIQVFRKSGGLWLETILHDQDTLETANINSLAEME